MSPGFFLRFRIAAAVLKTSDHSVYYTILMSFFKI